MPRILVIEDSLADSALFMQMLATDGYLVETATTLAEGIDRTKAKTFDAVVLNLNLPDSQGIATYLAARPELMPMPIVVLTNVSDDHTVALAYQHGAYDYLIKSKVTADWLVQSVKHAILRARGSESALSAELDEQTVSSRSVWKQERVDEVVVLRLLPRRLLEASVIMAIEERLTSLVEGGNQQLIVSMENVDYISNAALGVLIGTQKKIRNRNGRLHLAHVKENVRNQLGSRQIHRLFKIYDNVTSAIASIAAAT